MNMIEIIAVAAGLGVAAAALILIVAAIVRRARESGKVKISFRVEAGGDDDRDDEDSSPENLISGGIKVNGKPVNSPDELPWLLRQIIKLVPNEAADTKVVKVTRTFGSLKDIPPDVRARLEKVRAADGAAGETVARYSSKDGTLPPEIMDRIAEMKESGGETKITIVINGERHEYNSLEEVPKEFRKFVR
ncbi:MAG TPA: hypothetical protein PL033_03280 [Candidatus Brocadiia bacterium]|nr:hypothetical protein [Candidatus Brocadiia bacterium]